MVKEEGIGHDISFDPQKTREERKAGIDCRQLKALATLESRRLVAIHLPMVEAMQGVLGLL